MKAKSGIPIFKQSNEAIGGIHIVKLPIGEDTGHHTEKMGAHRDDFFIFFVLTSGRVIMQCDTIDIEINPTSIFFVKPFQVHSAKQVSSDASGYFISIAPFLIPNLCSEIFQNLEISEQEKKIEDSNVEDLLNCISLLHKSFSKQQLNKAQIINGLFIALVYNFSNLFKSSKKHIAEHKNQSALISANFKNKLIHAIF